jgi:hypothetical protein
LKGCGKWAGQEQDEAVEAEVFTAGRNSLTCRYHFGFNLKNSIFTKKEVRWQAKPFSISKADEYVRQHQ